MALTRCCLIIDLGLRKVNQSTLDDKKLLEPQLTKGLPALSVLHLANPLALQSNQLIRDMLRIQPVNESQGNSPHQWEKKLAH